MAHCVLTLLASDACVICHLTLVVYLHYLRMVAGECVAVAKRPSLQSHRDATESIDPVMARVSDESIKPVMARVSDGTSRHPAANISK